MKKHPLVTLAAALLSSGLAHADKADTTFNAELEAGLEYDSNLSVEELDRISTQSDTAYLLKGKANGQWGATDKLTVKGGYSYAGKTYQDYGKFDLAIHQLFADAAYDVGQFTVGASHYYALARLDNSDFLDLNLTSVYASTLINKQIFVRAAGNVQNKHFDGRSNRNAENLGLDGDVYYFFNQGKTFVSVGVSIDEEDANGAEFDYSGIGFKSKVQNKFDLMGKESKLALSYRYVDRDYDHPTPAIGEARNDTRHTTRLSWEVALQPYLDVVSALEYGDYDSNLSSVNYSETVGSVTLRLKM